MPWLPGTVPRYMLPDIVGAESGWRRDEVHRDEQGGSWCSQWAWLMPYGVMWTAKGLTARCTFWGWMLLRRACARVWECPLLIHTMSARDCAGVGGMDTLVGGAPMRRIVGLSSRLRTLRLALCRCLTSWAGVCTPVCSGFLLGRSAVLKGAGQERA